MSRRRRHGPQEGEHTIYRGEDEIEVKVRYSITPGCPAQLYGPPEDCYPADPPEVELIGPHDLTPDEVEQATQEIMNEHDFDDGDEY